MTGRRLSCLPVATLAWSGHRHDDSSRIIGHHMLATFKYTFNMALWDQGLFDAALLIHQNNVRRVVSDGLGVWVHGQETSK